MILQWPLLALLLQSCNGFTFSPSEPQLRDVAPLFSTLDGTVGPSMDQNVIVAGPREQMLDVAMNLKSEFGVFIVDKDGQEDLRKAADELEAVSEAPSFDEDTKTKMLGNWELVCTTSKAPAFSGIDTKRFPFFNDGPFKDIRLALNKCLVVQQAILAKNSDQIDRVDHILQYKPPKTLQEILDSLPSLDINPLDVTRGKVSLIHEADVSNTGPGFSIGLKLASIVLNVAGTSQYLDPDGQDVLGINSPLKEFQAGTFETTYLDDSLRISRSKRGSIDQLRVFIRSEETTEVSEDSLDEEYFDEFDKFGEEEDDDDQVLDADVIDDVSPSDS